MASRLRVPRRDEWKDNISNPMHSRPSLFREKKKFYIFLPVIFVRKISYNLLQFDHRGVFSCFKWRLNLCFKWYPILDNKAPNSWWTKVLSIFSTCLHNEKCILRNICGNVIVHPISFKGLLFKNPFVVVVKKTKDWKWKKMSKTGLFSFCRKLHPNC